MEGHASISSDILARYAGDAALEAPGVVGLVESHLPRHRGVRIAGEDGRVRVEIHLQVAWDASIPEVARDVQLRVRDYLRRMADLTPEAVDVLVDEVGAPD
jgi:uncharacterized alkaline shock family protein YloU